MHGAFHAEQQRRWAWLCGAAFGLGLLWGSALTILVLVAML